MSVLERMKRNVFKWFGHEEKMGEKRLVKDNVKRNKGHSENAENMEVWSERFADEERAE